MKLHQAILNRLTQNLMMDEFIPWICRTSWYLEYLVNFFILAIESLFFFGDIVIGSRFILAKDFFIYIFRDYLIIK
jgi:hypothetical protein